MDISKVVDYEATYALQLLHPVTEEPTGIVFHLRSAESDQAKQIARKHLDEIYARRQRGKLLSGREEIRRELERVASCIASWDWGEHTWKGEKPTLTMDKAVEILEEAGWIYGQVKAEAEKLENFMPPSPKKSAKPSE